MVPGSNTVVFCLVQEGSMNSGDKPSAMNGESAPDVTVEKVMLWRRIPQVVLKVYT